MYIQQLREMIPPPVQNIVKVCNQITLLIIYYVSSRLVNFLKVTDAPVQVSDILFLTVCFSFMILPSIYSLCLFLWCLLASPLLLFTLSTLLWFGSCKHCILACFLWSKIFEHSLSSHGDCCFCSYRPILCNWDFGILFNVFPSPIYVVTII